MKSLHHKAIREAWILDYLREHMNADSVNQDFHEKYHVQFPEFKQHETFFGSQPVAQAMRDLRRMADDGLVVVSRIPLGANWQPGFPKWVYSYSLSFKTKP